MGGGKVRTRWANTSENFADRLSRVERRWLALRDK